MAFSLLQDTIRYVIKLNWKLAFLLSYTTKEHFEYLNRSQSLTLLQDTIRYVIKLN